MAHNLTQKQDGRYEFAYTGDAPWHGLGQHMAEAATREQIMKAAGLDWTILPEPIYLGDGSRVPGQVANVRSDTREVLGVVSGAYRVLQIGDSIRFVDEVAESAGAKYHTAGSIRGGRQIFATAKLPESIAVTPNDVVDQYLLMVNTFDGSMGYHLRWTTVRVVCNNTLTAALQGHASYAYSVRHIGDMDAELAEARRALRLGRRYFQVAGETYKALAAKEIGALSLDRFLTEFLPITPRSFQGDAAERESIIGKREQVRVLFESGVGSDLAGRTAWGAYNAATEWIDHVRTARQDGGMRVGAAAAAVLGIGQELRDRAMDAALMLV